MAAYSQTTRDAAVAARDAATWTAKVTGVVGLGFAAGGDDRQGAALVFAVAALNLVADAASRVASDPPREDFRRETRTPQPHIWPSRLLARFEDEPRLFLALAVAKHATDTGRSLKAHVTAFERYQGVLEYGSATEVHAIAGIRQGEAEALASQAGASLRFLSVGLQELATQLPEQDDLSGLLKRGGGSDADVMALPDSFFATLFLGGMTWARFRTVSRQRTTLRIEARDLELAPPALSLEKFAAELSHWEPPQVAVVEV